VCQGGGLGDQNAFNFHHDRDVHRGRERCRAVCARFTSLAGCTGDRLPITPPSSWIDLLARISLTLVSIAPRDPGAVEIGIGLLVLAGLVSTRLAAVGALLAFATSLVTISFLVTPPEAWVPSLGDAQHSFPYLSGAGRLVLKDVMLLAGGFLLRVQSAKALRASYPLATIADRKSGLSHSDKPVST
jgi:hypothetical protein